MLAQKQKSAVNKTTLFLLLILNLIAVTKSFAQPPVPYPAMCMQATRMRVVVSVGTGGIVSSQIGQSQTFPIVNPITDEFFIYSTTQSSQTRQFFDVFLGVELPFYYYSAFQIGLGFQQPITSFTVKGNLTQGADFPSADTFTYSYSIMTRQLLLEAKIFYALATYYHPYLFAGVGIANNHATNFQTSVPPFLTFTREYKNNYQTSLAYQFGFGIDVDIWDDLRLGVGYRYVNLGKSSLGQASIDGTNVSGTLSQPTMHGNELIAQITVLF